jgi:hypothetical protein
MNGGSVRSMDLVRERLVIKLLCVRWLVDHNGLVDF